MDFRYGAEHDDLRSMLSGLLRAQLTPARVRELAATEGYDRQLWNRLGAELGVLGLHVPESDGGAGGTLVDSAIVFEECGRTLAPVPLATNTFAIEAVRQAADPDQRDRLLKGLTSGATIGAFAACGPDAADPASATVRVEHRGTDHTLTGNCGPVLHGGVAEVFIVPAVRGGAVALYVVDAAAPGVRVHAETSFDPTRPVAAVALTDAPAELLTAGQIDSIDRVLDVARVLLAAEMLGGAQACLSMTLDHVKTRKQFGRPIGSFQAVKHACAEMMIEIDATRAAVMFAASTATVADELRVSAPLVKAQAAETFTLCAGSAIQLHGGIGFTWEHDLHLYFRRAKTTEALFGSPATHRALLADRAGL